MNVKLVALGVVLFILAGLGVYYFVDRNNADPTSRQEQAQQQVNDTKRTCVADECLKDESISYPVGSVSADIQSVMASAIADEYAAKDTYQAVIDTFGSVRPFSMIVRSEEQHISSIKALFDKYGLSIPADTTQVTVPTTLKAACTQGVSIEQADIALYNDTVLPAVQDYQDMVSGVYEPARCFIQSPCRFPEM